MSNKSNRKLLSSVIPSVNAKWEVKEVPTSPIGANQVLIKIHASGICYTDVHITKGGLGVKFPFTIGHEPAGEIVAIGEGVTTRKVGDRVGVPWLQSTCGRCEWCQRGKLFFCPNQIATGINIAGSHAEYMVAFADATQLLPNGLSYGQAAPIFCAGYTVYSGLRFAHPKPHERIAVVGIGALGHLGIQYSKATGFETNAVTHSKDKEELAYKLGADVVVSDGDILEKECGTDVILAKSSSYKATADSIKGLRPDGRIILMGVSMTEPLSNISRNLVQTWSHHWFKVMTEIFALDEISSAYDKVANGNVRFKAIHPSN